MQSLPQKRYGNLNKKIVKDNNQPFPYLKRGRGWDLIQIYFIDRLARANLPIIPLFSYIFRLKILKVIYCCKTFFSFILVVTNCVTVDLRCEQRSHLSRIHLLFTSIASKLFQYFYLRKKNNANILPFYVNSFSFCNCS